jgi:tRNA modification GTPase
LSREVEALRGTVLGLSAAVEAVLDFADEDDVAHLPATFADDCQALAAELDGWLSRPRAEPLREGFKVVLAGPPNVGKSSLFNVLTESEAAITSPLPGTTRDVIVRSVALDGVPFAFLDTAGLREAGEDAIEAIGIDRARDALERADLVLWLGPEGQGGEGWEIDPRCDLPDRPAKGRPRHTVSARTGEGIAALRADLVTTARAALPAPGEAAIGERQARLLGECRDAVQTAGCEPDPLLAAEALRLARVALDRLVGRSGTEDMLDALFGRFCIGK